MVKEKGSEFAHSDTVQSLKNKMGSSVNYVYEKFFPHPEQDQNQEHMENKTSDESRVNEQQDVNNERKEK
jgi:hypothetical protein